MKSIGNAGPDLHDPWLDVVRGVAILAVVTVHAMQNSDGFTLSHGGETNGLFTRVASNGAFGVELFFFLSGWLLAFIYGIQNKELGVKYWSRRVARIYPLWLMWLIIEFLLFFCKSGGLVSTLDAQTSISSLFLINGYLLVPISTLTFTLWFSDLLYTNGVVPGSWSIQAEVGHYLLFPLIRKNRVNRTLYILTLLNLITFFFKFHKLEKDGILRPFSIIVDAWMRLGLYATFGYFLLGVLCQQIDIWENSFTKITNSFKMLCISKYSLIIYFLSWFLLPVRFSHHGQIGTTLWVAFFLLISRGLVKYRFSRGLFSQLGRYSYFIFFVHFEILRVVGGLLDKLNLRLHFSGGFALSFVFYLIPTILISILLAIPSEKYIEKPAMKFARSRFGKSTT